MIIHYSSNFEKDFKKLPKSIQELAIKQEGIFRNDPHDVRLHSKPLKGRLKGLWSFRVTRNYRVIYAWKDKENVLFYEVGDRKFIYQ